MVESITKRDKLVKLLDVAANKDSGGLQYKVEIVDDMAYVGISSKGETILVSLENLIFWAGVDYYYSKTE